MANEVSIGYVPTSFPRDPISVNQFDEHSILGQIIEPLVDATNEGAIGPGLAQSWTFDREGKVLTFYIRQDRTFSNGEKVTAKDVVYSLKRHIEKDTTSQSKAFLLDVQDIKQTGDYVVQVALKNKNPAILKALTRDQLGIVPNGWSFQPGSHEPIVGSGLYRLLKENNSWILRLNSTHPDAKTAQIRVAKLIFYNSDGSIPQAEIPTVVPAATDLTLEAMSKQEWYNVSSFEARKRLSFTQTTIWLHPGSPRWHDKVFRDRMTEVINYLVENKLTRSKGLVRATGIIPIGVSGHIPPSSSAVKIKKTAKKKATPIKVKVALLQSIFSDFFAR